MVIRDQRLTGGVNSDHKKSIEYRVGGGSFKTETSSRANKKSFKVNDIKPTDKKQISLAANFSIYSVHTYTHTYICICMT